MEVPRQGGRGRSSRSRKDASNKENICPSTLRDSTVSEIFRRRSPLPEGFPRSPLQDITHIICPQNIWPDNQDPQADQQVCKKIRKDGPAETCMMACEFESRSSWKGLIACESQTSSATIVRVAEARKEDEVSKLNTDVKAGADCDEAKTNTDIKAVASGDKAKINTDNQGHFLHADEVLNETIRPPHSGIEGEPFVQPEEQATQAEQGRTSQQKSSSVEDGGDSSKRDISGRRVPATVLKEKPTKRLQQSTQPKKKSSLLMFR